jgi:hypothetical protein
MGVKTRKLGNINDQLVEWQAVHVADGSTGLTAVSGRGYFINTTSATQTVTLPASPAIGDTISIVDYASTFATNNVTIDPGSNKIEGSTNDGILSTNDQTHTLVFTDSTQGWKIVNQDTAANIQAAYTSATGGTVTTSGNFKIHSFTGDGNFVVASVGNAAGGGAYASKVDYLVVAGGAGGGWDRAGGGGAGGFREGRVSSPAYTASPLVAPDGLTISAQTYPITVGAGGAGGNNSSNPVKPGQAGSPSTFSTITSAGGGGGGAASPATDGIAGGSGGGAAGPGCGAAGNTPPVSPPQGNAGGNTPSTKHGSGGGGATAAGVTGDGPLNPGTAASKGGAGATTHITGSPVTYAGGGGGGFSDGGSGCSPFPGGAGGAGGGANGGSYPGGQGSAASANLGGGGGGGSNGPNSSPDGNGGAGGKGIVIIRYKYQN